MSEVVGIVGAYRQDPGRSKFEWAPFLNKGFDFSRAIFKSQIIFFENFNIYKISKPDVCYICVIGEIMTILISWITIAFFSLTRLTSIQA